MKITVNVTERDAQKLEAVALAMLREKQAELAGLKTTSTQHRKILQAEEEELNRAYDLALDILSSTLLAKAHQH